MTRTPDPQTTFFADLPEPRLSQFRMHQLSVWNWGTFSKVHTVHFAEKGMLMLGPSGSGKSTLLDAISAALIPPRLVHFNAAADGASRSRDRSLMSYLRGAWAEKGQEHTNEVTKQFLRPDATASAIALAFRTVDHHCLTIVRVFWVTSSGPGANINEHYMVVDGPFDLVTELGAFSGHRRKLKAQLTRPEIRHHDDSYSSYQEHWCRVMGISGTAALELLHRTQSTKSLSDLNTFLREFMLSVPETFEVAAKLVEEFSDLDQAHRAVVSAREQIQLLSGARDQHAQREHALQQSQALNELINGMGPFRESVRVGLLEAELQSLATLQRAAKGELTTVDTQLRGLEDELTALDQQHRDLGGAHIDVLETKISDLTQVRERATRNQERVNHAATVLGGAAPPEDAASFAALLTHATRIVEQAATRSEDFTQRDRSLAIAKSDLDREFRTSRAEADALAKSSSNIPSDHQALRTRLCEALKLPVANVPFVGELLEVRADEVHWSGAIERLLHGFALSLLVDIDDAKRVAKWVDETHLRGRLVYYPTDPNQPVSGREPRQHSIINKLEKKPHRFSAWVRREMLERFDYACVSSSAELGSGENRITVMGQIRSRHGRTDKDDRFDLKDRRRWVLGFDSAQKYALYRDRAQQLAQQIGACDQQIEALSRERQGDLVRERAARSLMDFDWQDLDVASIAQRVQELTQKLSALRAGNPALDQINGQLASARVRQRELQQRIADLGAQLKSVKEAEGSLSLKLQTAKVSAGALAPATRQALLERVGTWAPTMDTLADAAARIERGLREEVHQHAQTALRLDAAIVAVFADFLRRWPEEQGALQAQLVAAPDFFAKLDRVEVDGLPKHEARFFGLLRTQSSQRLAELSRHLSLARREITAKLEDVNDALHSVRYNPDSYLRIKVVDLNLPEPTQFKRRLADAVAHQFRQISDSVEAENQFEIVRALVQDLRSEEAERRRWREAVLDVRRHVEFMAEELDVRTEEQIEVYSGGSGKSGGQRQKLTATCLAAALRYKLGGSDGGPPQYAAVVLDEAFNNTDPEFTATCMDVFTELGFQMIVATPSKSVMTLEEYVGGAVYVTISNRHTSSLRHIEYDDEHARLVLTSVQRRSDDAHA